ncbi:LysR family transcriptional regulator [Sutterella sp.]|uniref:LysR family transcriptional regulator n=1 Tax=Sutterella sp. TaxID=1981025 RepID=UPI0026E096A5|nr:LysR family transcriptional regulator [Sutterella sp.]MDO5532859.1 LysR family transcriptional regulator [Sutterella sp.]
MELKTLRQFLAVARTGSVSEAARNLSLTQPAVSMGVKRLEEELGVALFRREGSRLVITEAGAVALEHAERILGEVETLGRSLEVWRRRSAGLKLAFCDQGPMWFLMPRYRMLLAEPAGMEVTDRVFPADESAAALLRRREADIVVTDAPLDGAGIVSEPLVRDLHYLSLPPGHPLAGRTEIELPEAGDLTVLFFELGGAFSRSFKKYLTEEARNLTVLIENDYFVFQERLRRTNAATFTTSLVRHYRFDGPARAEILIPTPATEIEYWICRRTDAPEAAEAFVKFAHDLVRTSGLPAHRPRSENAGR